MQRLKIDRTVANKLISRLKSERFITTPGKSKGKYFSHSSNLLSAQKKLLENIVLKQVLELRAPFPGRQ